MYFFGQKVMEAQEAADKGFAPGTKKITKGVLLFNSLPEYFSINDVSSNKKVEKSQLYRWRNEGYIEDVGKGKYKKTIKNL